MRFTWAEPKAQSVDIQFTSERERNLAKGVFLHREDSIYEDLPEVKYQFPSQYLSRASKFVGDWVLYYEPRRGPTARGYFAIARVDQIVSDPSAPGMFIAMIAPGSFLEFERPVPFSGSDGVVERGLLNEEGNISGRAQAAVRPVSLEDFERIFDLGMPEEVPLLPRVDAPVETVLQEEQAPFEIERERVAVYGSRIVRDRIFRRIVLDAYDCRCAITGLRIINGGGRAEVQAAHIRPVEYDGPDSIKNGIALSGTVHWMFDRGLISLSDEFDVLVSRQVNDADSVWSLVNPSRQAILPKLPIHKPHPAYLAWHRENCFKQ